MTKLFKFGLLALMIISSADATIWGNLTKTAAKAYAQTKRVAIATAKTALGLSVTAGLLAVPVITALPLFLFTSEATFFVNA